MKKILMATLLTLACTLSSSAEIRLLNYTGEDLKIDILHSSGQSRDIAISKDVTLSPAIGPVNPRRTSEVMVVKDTSGKELGRFDVYSQLVTVLSRRGDGFFASNVGFFKGPTEHGYVKILNATGQDIHYSYEKPSFILRQGKIENDKQALRDWVVVWMVTASPTRTSRSSLALMSQRRVTDRLSKAAVSTLQASSTGNSNSLRSPSISFFVAQPRRPRTGPSP